MNRTNETAQSRIERLNARIADLIASAQFSFEAGFASEAARKRAIECLSHAYSYQRDLAHDACIGAAAGLEGEARIEHFNAFDIPFDLHQVRERHFATFTRWAGESAADLVRAMGDMRAAMKAAPVGIAKPAPTEAEEKAQRIYKAISEVMAQRKADYLRALDLGRHFGGLPVSVNSHYVHGHKGAVFIRNFFYLGGKLTALNVIIAAAQTLEDEKAAA